MIRSHQRVRWRRAGSLLIGTGALVAINMSAWLSVVVAQDLTQPGRIVSMNLCTDQLVLLLADRRNIVSVSNTAADPAISAHPDLAAGVPINFGLAEEVLTLDPDLIITSSFNLRATPHLLRQLGYEVAEIPTASSVADIRRNVLAVADAVGAPARGAALVAKMDRRLAAARPTGPARPLAAFYWANGFTSGRGTLANEILLASGFRSLATEMEIDGVRQLPLERLLMADPDILVVSQTRNTPALANRIFHHPALAKLFNGRPVANLPNTLWNCGTPAVADAFEALQAVRRQYLSQTSSTDRRSDDQAIGE